MGSSDRSTPQPYAASPPPFTDKVAEVTRAAWEEFYRIAERFVSVDKPAAMALTASESIAIQPTTAWDRLFDEGVVYDWQAPLGQHDGATGIWTCPQEGLYLIQPVVEVPAFPNPGTRIYEATMRTTLRPINGDPDKVLLSKTGGGDDVALRLFASFLRPLNRGDQLWFDLDLTEETYTGNITVFAVLNVCRQGSVK